MNPEQAIRDAIVPAAIYPAHEAPLMPVEGRRVVGYERYAGDLLVPVYEAPAPAVRTETVIVRRGVDEIAQRIAATGICAAGVGWCIDLAGHGVEAVLGGFGIWPVLAIAAFRFRPASRTTTITTNNNGWLSHSHTTKH